MAAFQEPMESVRKTRLYGYKDVGFLIALKVALTPRYKQSFNFCNIKELPPELNYAMVNMACGEAM